ncbi:hypothetical protein C8Q80DRAFT_1275733 [Daedaleopsis nitida]|nr:hypothetical protein C8Q80DRAFT_1275733 [Daedaleopsis nitida]
MSAHHLKPLWPFYYVLPSIDDKPELDAQQAEFELELLSVKALWNANATINKQSQELLAEVFPWLVDWTVPIKRRVHNGGAWISLRCAGIGKLSLLRPHMGIMSVLIFHANSSWAIPIRSLFSQKATAVVLSVDFSWTPFGEPRIDTGLSTKDCHLSGLPVPIATSRPMGGTAAATQAHRAASNHHLPHPRAFPPIHRVQLAEDMTETSDEDIRSFLHTFLATIPSSFPPALVSRVVSLDLTAEKQHLYVSGQDTGGHHIIRLALVAGP